MVFVFKGKSFLVLMMHRVFMSCKMMDKFFGSAAKQHQ